MNTVAYKTWQISNVIYYRSVSYRWPIRPKRTVRMYTYFYDDNSVSTAGAYHEASLEEQQLDEDFKDAFDYVTVSLSLKTSLMTSFQKFTVISVTKLLQ